MEKTLCESEDSMQNVSLMFWNKTNSNLDLIWQNTEDLWLMSATK